MTPTTFDAELFYRASCMIGEGPFWHRDRLYWVDILQSQLYSCDAHGNDPQVILLPSHVGAVAPWAGGFIAATQQGIGLLKADGQFTLLPSSPRLPPEIRFNDGKLDPNGRFWCGTMAYDSAPGAAALYCVDRQGGVKQVFDGVTISNGLDWDAAAGKFYYIDTMTYRMDVFDYEANTGAITNRRTAINFPKELGLPDGMARDAAGRLWVAFWGGNHVVCFDPKDGRQLFRIRVPAQLASSCWINSTDGMIYITSARLGLSADDLAREPLSGSVFCARLPSL